MKKVGIIGVGRFGKTLIRLFGGDFEVRIFDIREGAVKNLNTGKNIMIAKNLRDIFGCDVIFYTVPISEFENAIKSHKKYLTDQLIIDVLSVKIHPKKVLTKHLKDTKVQALLTHPMFGPDSSKKGFDGLPLMIDRFKTDSKKYNFWINYFKSKGLNVIQMSAEEHDLLAANSQGLTHFIGRLLENFGTKSTKIDSIGTKSLLEVKNQTINDTWQLFHDLQTFNPYTKRMRRKLKKSFNQINERLKHNSDIIKEDSQMYN